MKNGSLSINEIKWTSAYELSFIINYNARMKQKSTNLPQSHLVSSWLSLASFAENTKIEYDIFMIR